MKQLILAALAGTMLAPVAATAQQVPERTARHARIVRRPILHLGPVFQHRVGHRSVDQPTARRHQARRPDADEPQPAVSGAVAGPWHGLLARRRTLAVVSIGSNAVSFIDTATNSVRHTTYVGRSPHEAFFRPDGQEVWVSVRGEDYIAVLDGTTYKETGRIPVPNGPA